MAFLQVKFSEWCCCFAAPYCFSRLISSLNVSRISALVGWTASENQVLGFVDFLLNLPDIAASAALQRSRNLKFYIQGWQALHNPALAIANSLDLLAQLLVLDDFLVRVSFGLAETCLEDDTAPAGKVLD